VDPHSQPRSSTNFGFVRLDILSIEFINVYYNNGEDRRSVPRRGDDILFLLIFLSKRFCGVRFSLLE
jgi:hypothetical protein